MEIKFKIATFEDVPAIVNLCNECFDENTDLKYAKKVFLDTQDDPNQIYLIGLLNDEVVAHTKIAIIPTMFKDMETFAILNHVCVKPKYRKLHIATKMLEECEKISKEHNCICMELWSKNFRQPAHACYKSYGFEVMDAKFFTKDI